MMLKPALRPPLRAPMRGATTLREGGGVSLAALLFGAGEDGFLFGNFADLSKLYTTSAGEVPVAANDDPTGLLLDSHSWGGQNFAAMIAAQPELITNGSFGSATDWTLEAELAITGGKLVATATAATRSASQAVSLTAGQFYRLLFTLSGFVGGSAAIQIADDASGTNGSTLLTKNTDAAYAQIAKALAGNDTVRFRFQIGSTSSVDDTSLKLVPGNHAIQATSTQRPLWRVNGGKPYLSLDGNDDCIVTPFIPTAAVTLACATRFNPTSSGVQSAAMGGGISTGNKRCFIGCLSASDSIGRLSPGWGTETIGTNVFGPDIRGQDHVIVLTGDAVSRDLWLDGVLLDSRSPAGTGPDGTGGGVALGRYNNNGAASLSLTGNVYAALALNRRAAAAEIARITSDFQRTYQ